MYGAGPQPPLIGGGLVGGGLAVTGGDTPTALIAIGLTILIAGLLTLRSGWVRTARIT